MVSHQKCKIKVSGEKRNLTKSIPATNPFTCSKSTIETLEKDLNYVQS